RAKEILKPKMEELKERSRERLRDQGFGDESIEFEEYLNLRYRGTESALMVIRPSEQEPKECFGGDDWAFGRAVVKQDEQEFGFTLPDRDIIVDDVRVRGIGKGFEGMEKTVDQQLREMQPVDIDDSKAYSKSQVYFEGGRKETKILKVEDLSVGDR